MLRKHTETIWYKQRNTSVNRNKYEDFDKKIY